MNTRAARLQQMGAALLELEILNSRAQDTAASSSSSSSPGKSQGRESGPQAENLGAWGQQDWEGPRRRAGLAALGSRGTPASG